MKTVVFLALREAVFLFPGVVTMVQICKYGCVLEKNFLCS